MSTTTRALLIPAMLLLGACGDDPESTGAATLQVNDACGTGGLAGATVTEGATTVGTTDASGSLQLSGVATGQHTYAVGMEAYLPQDVTVSVSGGQTATGSADLVCQTKAVGDMARAFTAQIAGGFSGVTSASALQTLLYDGDAANDPTVISVRAAAAYAAGHVPGALNIPWKTVADDPVALLGAPFDTTRKFVDYCYTGHTGGIAAGVLNVLGYKTQNMKFGIVSWTTDTTAWSGATTPDYYCDATKAEGDPLRGPCAANDYAVETTANVPSTTYELPWLAHTGVATAWEAAQAAAQDYLAVAVPTISADALYTLLNDGDAANDPFIISVRSAADYAAGHIPGAVNMPYATIADEANLQKIPTDRDVVVYCYTGHTGAVATGILGTLGYHRVKNLKYGIYAWTTTPSGTAPAFAVGDMHDYAVVTGTSPGTP